MNRKPGTFSMHDMAKATGGPIQTVWLHRRKGRFDINDISSVANYIVSQQLVRGATNARAQEKTDEQTLG